MKVNRHFKRFTIEGMDIQCKMLSDTEVYVLKISKSAAFIMLGERLNVGSDYTLNLQCGNKTTSVKGTVVSEEIAGSEENRSIESGPVYLTGIRFDPSSVQGNNDFISFIDDFTGPNAPKGLARHIHLKIASGHTGANANQSFHVTQLSFGGMQLLTHAPLEVDEQIHLEMYLPGTEEPIKLIGRVANCTDTSGGSHQEYHVGIEYLDMKARDLQRLKDLIYQIENL